MVAIYVALIIYGRRTIDTVPRHLRDAVLADLKALGLDGYGKALPAEGKPAE
ncbi:CD1375 family protein [Peptococcus simiae]|uniref:CD1375 family protein n=1 Tax=Peptococcus simiae TaxID=1643805 RepID=A0ABW9GY66_9FIRM